LEIVQHAQIAAMNACVSMGAAILPFVQVVAKGLFVTATTMYTKQF
jgi:hypothetical protein